MATHSSILVWRIPMDRGAWWATVRGVTKSWDTTKATQHARMHVSHLDLGDDFRTVSLCWSPHIQFIFPSILSQASRSSGAHTPAMPARLLPRAALTPWPVIRQLHVRLHLSIPNLAPPLPLNLCSFPLFPLPGQSSSSHKNLGFQCTKHRKVYMYLKILTLQKYTKPKNLKNLCP